MKSAAYLKGKKIQEVSNKANIIDLLKKSKLEQKAEKRKSILIATSAISALAISGLIISL